MLCTQLKRVDFVVYFEKNVPLYVETVTFGDNFWQQRFSSEGRFFLNFSPTAFKEVKNCINMVTGRINKKSKNSYFNSYTS